MAVAYTCDMCGRKIENPEDTGSANIRGVDPGAGYTERPNGKGRRKRSRRYISLHMDLCAPCTRLLLDALQQLKRQEVPSTTLH